MSDEPMMPASAARRQLAAVGKDMIDLLAENARLRAALEQCAAPFTIKPADQDDIDWEGLAREFWRRMDVAGKAVQVIKRRSA